MDRGNGYVDILAVRGHCYGWALISWEKSTIADRQSGTAGGETRSFARFFYAYMGSLGLILAALPIGSRAFGLVPTFNYHAGYLQFATLLLGLLLAGSALYFRGPIARAMFANYLRRLRNQGGNNRPGGAAASVAFWPTIAIILLILTTFACFFIYRALFFEAYDNAAIKLGAEAERQAEAVRQSGRAVSPEHLSPQDPTFDEVLMEAGPTDINRSSSEAGLEPWLLLSYIGIFIPAELAFVLMALSEFEKDQLGIKERELIGG